MTKSGYQDKVIKNLLAITLYVPLIIAIIASSMKLYDFIYCTYYVIVNILLIYLS